MCIRDRVEDDWQIVEYGDVKTLQKKLAALIEDERFRKTLGEKNRERIQKFTWRNTAKQVLEGYKKLLTGSQK